MDNAIIKYIITRLSEVSTWRGIILIFAGGWATQNPELVSTIIPIAISLIGMIGASLPDKIGETK